MPAEPADARVSLFDVSPCRGWDKLSSPAAFDAVFRVRCSSQGLFARVLAKPSALPRPCFGITVSKKVCKTAVGRNYIKRVTRELLSEAAERLQGLDVVVQIRQRVIPSEFNAFRQEFHQHVNEIQKCRKSC